MAMAGNEIETRASRIREAGGGGLPGAALVIFHDREVKHRTLDEDARISEAFRLEQKAVEDERAEKALWVARDRDVAAARKPLEQRRGHLLAQIKGNTQRSSSEIETSDQQRERLARTTQGVLEIHADLLFAATASEPAELQDLFDEAMLSERPDRIRRLAPVILGRLSQLNEAKAIGAGDAWGHVRARYSEWRKANPSVMTQLRAVDDEIANVERPIDAKYIRAREAFRFGQHAQGIRM